MKKLRAGTIVNTFGIKGELKVQILTDFASDRFQKGKKLYLTFNNEEMCFVIKSARYHKGFALICFEGYEDINKVEIYKGLDIYVSLDDVAPLQDGYYFYQIIGLDVYGDDKKIGKVTDIDSYPSGTIMRIKTEDGSILVPYVPAFVKNISLEENRMDINVIEGLL